MSNEANKAIVQRIYAEIWNQGRMDVVDDIYATDFVDHNPAAPNLPAGVAGAQATFATFRAAFPDIHFTVDALVADGDTVVARWAAVGTHTAALMQIPPTGQQVSVTGIEINRIAGGKIVERWGNFDQLSMLQQLGVLPAMG